MGMRAYAALSLALFACAGTRADSVPPGPSPLPAAGLASKYVGDQGIRDDPAVVFAEDFEADRLETVWSRWESVQNRQIMSLSADVPAGSGGTRSLLMTHVGGASTGGRLYRRLLPGYEKLRVRFYVKFDPAGYVSRVWFDDIVVAQDYAGPINSMPSQSRDLPSADRSGAGLSCGQDPPRTCDKRCSSRTWSAVAGSPRGGAMHVVLRLAAIKSRHRIVDDSLGRPF